MITLGAPTAAAVYARLDAAGAGYAALCRGDRAVDLILGDEDVARVRRLLGSRRSRGTVAVNLFGVDGKHGSDYLGYSCLPEDLARRALSGRVAMAGGGWCPAPEDLVLCLGYRAVYHFSQQSGIHWRDLEENSNTPLQLALARAIAAAGLVLPLTHCALHNHLVQRGCGVTVDRLAAYIRHDFARGRKVFFHAWLMNQLPGEMNLFVIRHIAIQKRRQELLLDRLRELYEIVAVKTVSWPRRMRAGRRMRGGRWDRGGKPRIAVVVFDANPRPTSEDQRRVHRFVFNAKQLIKQDWRTRFVEDTNADEHANPVHSTDNEAEALAHLPLFFSPAEQVEILRRVDSLRGGKVVALGKTDDAKAPD